MEVAPQHGADHGRQAGKDRDPHQKGIPWGGSLQGLRRTEEEGRPDSLPLRPGRDRRSQEGRPLAHGHQGISQRIRKEAPPACLGEVLNNAAPSKKGKLMMRSQKNPLVLLALAILISSGASAAEPPLVLQQPTLNTTHIVFAFAGDLWTVSRDGGAAKQLTTGIGTESTPFFSPDGTRVAFAGEYDGNTDVYLVPADGGVPKRLTYHPGPDQVVGWTPDGRRTVFLSPRRGDAGVGLPRSYPVGLGGEGPPGQLQRFQPHVGRRQSLLPVRPERRRDAVRLRHQIEEG